MTIHRSARERLLREGQEAGPSITRHEGARGHDASIESSEFGPARIVRVARDGVAVCWTFSLEAEEARPPFYPDDVPYFAALPSTVAWDDESGLRVKWKVPLSDEERSEFKKKLSAIDLSGMPEGLAALAETFKEKSKEERVERMRELRDSLPVPELEWAKGALGDLHGTPLPDVAAILVSDIGGFHEERGWAVSFAEQKPPGSIRASLENNGAKRDLVALSSFGLTLIVLSDVLAEE